MSQGPEHKCPNAQMASQGLPEPDESSQWPGAEQRHLCFLAAGQASHASALQSAVGPVGVLEPAQHFRHAGAFPGTDFRRGDVLLGASEEVWEPDQ